MWWGDRGRVTSVAPPSTERRLEEQKLLDLSGCEQLAVIGVLMESISKVERTDRRTHRRGASTSARKWVESVAAEEIEQDSI